VLTLTLRLGFQRVEGCTTRCGCALGSWRCPLRPQRVSGPFVNVQVTLTLRLALALTLTVTQARLVPYYTLICNT
jgi:hypothetical protein